LRFEGMTKTITKSSSTFISSLVHSLSVAFIPQSMIK
jgi:hypothetical protein